MCVCCRRPNHLGYRAEMWQGGGVLPRANILAGHPHLKTVSWGLHSPNGVFLGKVYKTKVAERPHKY